VALASIRKQYQRNNEVPIGLNSDSAHTNPHGNEFVNLIESPGLAPICFDSGMLVDLAMGREERRALPSHGFDDTFEYRTGKRTNETDRADHFL
jgi:hypothetical protein